MLGGINPRVFGSSLIGVALVCGAWVLNSLSSTPTTPSEAALYVAEAAAPARVTIATTDKNTDGIEDWKEPFLTAAPVILNTSTSSFDRENTLTEQISIGLMENFLLSKSTNANSQTSASLAASSFAAATKLAQDKIYTETDVMVLNDGAPELVRQYGNSVAMIILNNDVKGLPSEVDILKRATDTGDQKYFDQLAQIAAMYAKNRDEMLALPVPRTLLNEHLDLINVFNALANTISAMTEIEKDPVKTLLRLKRYEDDATGLAYAVHNMYNALARYPSLFTASDAATFFSQYSQIQER